MISLGALFGVPVRMHMAFPVMMGSAFFFGKGLIVFAGLVSLSLHELAHALAARALGRRFEAIELMPFGGTAYMRTTVSPAHEFLIAAAGPAVSLLLALLLAASRLTGPLVQEFIRTNVSISACNLLPALPLDGGRMFRAAFSGRMGRPRATNLFIRIGVLLGALLVCLGVWSAIQGIVNPMLFLMGVYLIYAARKEKEGLAAALVDALHGRVERLDREGMLPMRWLAAPQDTPPEKLLTRLSGGSYHCFLLVDDQMRKVGTIDEGELIQRTFAARANEPSSL